MRIGMFGLRGLRPDLEITGFETAFAEIAPRLAARGHAVTIYCRASAHSTSNRPARADGVDLRYVPSPGGKNMSALASTLVAVVHALRRREFDIWFFVNVGLGYHCALARLSGRPVVLNVDGIDWERGKWGPFARAYVRSAARMAVRWCTALVTDCDAMRAYYHAELGRDSTMIAYGADIECSIHPERIAAAGVRPRDYYLVVGRLVPENSIDMMLEAFRRSRTTKQLVVVGGANYHDRFHDRVSAIAARDSRIRLVGHVADQNLLRELWCNSYAYLHGHSVGGTNPSLLRAMGYGACVLALDTVFNREVLADAGAFFPRDADALARLIERVDETPGLAETYRASAPRRIHAAYSWDRITDQYEWLFQSLATTASRLDGDLPRSRATPLATRSRMREGRDLVAPRR